MEMNIEIGRTFLLIFILTDDWKYLNNEEIGSCRREEERVIKQRKKLQFLLNINEKEIVFILI